jgi:CheY-like chemotaxis protein
MADRSRPLSGERRRIPRVLVVDDEPLLGRVLQLLLSNEFEVTATADPNEALSLLTTGPYVDVVLCDVMMPVMNGVELRERVHAVSPELAARFVFITAGIPGPEERRLLESVPNAVFTKPFRVTALRDHIRGMTSRATRRRVAARH